MKKIFLVTISGLLVSFLANAQGTVRGKIADKNGETLIGVVVKLQSNPAGGKTTDLDGNFSIKLNDSTIQTLIITYIGFDTIKETVRAINNEVVIKDFTLKETSHELKEVVIEGKSNKAKDYYMENVKKNSSTTIDYISSETMKKTGDQNVNAAITRVSGVSSSNNGFLTVRGIGDRYVKTTINGSRIPTLDPYTNNIRLDLFPASLVDNIIITKTASPDLPGDWAGAYISVETKDYPDKLSVNVESSFGYNNQTTFKNVITSQRSSTDWLGYDKDFRDHSQNPNGSYGDPHTPSQYEELVAAGLGNYYNSLGVTATTPWNDSYFKLGLVQLGVLAKADYNNTTAVKAAEDKFNGHYSDQYYNEVYDKTNGKSATLGQSFANNWNDTVRKVPLNFSQSFSIGNQTKLFGRPLGFIGGFRYNSSTQYDPHSVSNRTAAPTPPLKPGDVYYSDSSSQVVSTETNGWSALFNVAYKYHPNHSISLMFMPNLTGVNNVRNLSAVKDLSNVKLTKAQFYEERKQLVYQLKSEHYIPRIKLKVDLNASYTNGNSKAPDFKNLIYLQDSLAHTYQIGSNVDQGIHRYYRYLTDNLFDSRLSAELPIFEKPALPRKLKFGGAYQENDKKNDQYDYTLVTPGISALPFDGNINNYFTLNKFATQTDTTASYDTTYRHTLKYYYTEGGNPANHTFGTSTIMAGFAMLDYSIVSRLRVSGGLRVEKANIYTDVRRYDSLKYAPDDWRRHGFNPGKLDETNYLPSTSVIYKLKKDESMNLRFNYSQTLARPSIRELSSTVVYDYVLRFNVFGNPNLKTAHVKNYDMRWETYFKKGDNVSVSLFYKDFTDHIVVAIANNGAGYTWRNSDKSFAEGIELEGKKILTKHFNLMANATFVNSETTIDGNHIKMFGQAPYVLNGIFTYNADSIGLTMAVSYNVQGPRLAIYNGGLDGPFGIPNVYELPRNLLNFKVTKTLGKHFSVSLTVQDILNSPIKRAYGYGYEHSPASIDNKQYPGGWVLYDKYRYGTIYMFNVLYKL